MSNRIFRTYPLQTYQNNKKNDEIIKIYSEYKKVVSILFEKHLNYYLVNNNFNINLDVKNIKTPLSERYKVTASRQSLGIVKLWIKKRKLKVKSLIHKSSLDSYKKRKYHIVINGNIRTPQEIRTISGEKIFIEKEDINFVKSIFRNIKWRKPFFKQISMDLNNNTCQIRDIYFNKKIYKAKKFEAWIHLASLVPKKKIRVPLNYSRYLKNKISEGKIVNAIRINIVNNKVKFFIILEKEMKNFTPEVECIGVDFGIKNLFAVSTGDLFGKEFGKKINDYDNKIIKLRSSLDKQNIPVRKSKRYRTLKRKAREYIKNEINRNINKIVKNIKPEKIIFEKIDFRYSNISKKMNRILSNCGRKILKQKIVMIQFEDFNIKVEEVNPAYSSQECNRCGFVHSSNRINRNKFRCKNCNFEKHSDINAARNLIKRSSFMNLEGISGKNVIKKHLFNKFKQNILQFNVRDSNINYISSNSRAIFLDYENKCLSFEDYYDILKSGIKI